MPRTKPQPLWHRPRCHHHQQRGNFFAHAPQVGVNNTHQHRQPLTELTTSGATSHKAMRAESQIFMHHHTVQLVRLSVRIAVHRAHRLLQNHQCTEDHKLNTAVVT